MCKLEGGKKKGTKKFSCVYWMSPMMLPKEGLNMVRSCLLLTHGCVTLKSPC